MRLNCSASRAVAGLALGKLNQKVREQDIDNEKPLTIGERNIMIALISAPLLGAAGYSLVYLLGGGGLFGALLIFIVAKMLGK
jgi:hypothetical protein